MRGAVRNILVKHFRELNHDYRNAVLLAGAGRGGTTWVAEIINYKNDFRDMFEPFYAEMVPQAAAFGNRQYLRIADDRPQYLEFATSVFAGTLRGERVDMFNRRLFCSRRLIKDVRANLLLGWIRRHFPQLPIVWLWRHPLATVQSRMAIGIPMDIEAEFFAQPDLMADHLAPFAVAMREASSEFERQVFGWCAEHYVPLRQLREGDVYVAFYEEIVADPESAVPPLFAHIGLRADMAAVRRRLHLPSKTTRLDAGLADHGGDRLESWRRRMSPADIKRGMAILALFGLDRIYADGPMPDRAGVWGELTPTRLIGSTPPSA